MNTVTIINHQTGIISEMPESTWEIIGGSLPFLEKLEPLDLPKNEFEPPMQAADDIRFVYAQEMAHLRKLCAIYQSVIKDLECQLHTTGHALISVTREHCVERLKAELAAEKAKNEKICS